MRDVRGNPSEPTVACGEQLERPALRSDSLGADYTCDNWEEFLDPTLNGDSSGIAGADSAPSDAPFWVGCALAPFAPAPARVAGLASILMALLTLARRRRAQT